MLSLYVCTIQCWGSGCARKSVSEDLTTFSYTQHLEDVTYPSLYARNHEVIHITSGLA